MRFFVGALIALVAGTAVAQDNCNCECKVDSCFQALAGTSPFPAEATVADCRSFMWTVVTVAAETVTTTEITTATATSTSIDTKWTTITVTTVSANLLKRQANGGVPDYATDACPQPTDYSSACKCLGVTEGGTSYHHVATTDTVTTTSTVTTTEGYSTTTTATESAAATDYYFMIQVDNIAENGQWQGRYMYTEPEGASAPFLKRVAFTTNINQALIFRARPNNTIVQDDGTPFTGEAIDTKSEQLYLEDVGGYVPYTCTLNPTDKTVGCTGSGTGGTYSLFTIRNNGQVLMYKNTAGITADQSSLGPVQVVLKAISI
ncbi:hypothetical protein TWF481_002123 [Arthrobotrys musiformis]|uniref:Uncharacterized protein n=1 Tax=Arthrobotrys musiformis TaxID=47236 RepID=A0AAV9VUA9_9PEZI